MKDFELEVLEVKKTASEAIDYVRGVYPENIRFVVTEKDFKSIALYIKVGAYDTMIVMYGYLFVLSLLEYFVQLEEYERCQQIIENINRFNAYFREYKIPNKL